MFAIGATVMSAGLLDSMSDIYDCTSRTFRGDIHRDKINEWLDHPNYTEVLKSIVLNLMNPNPEKRITIEELWKFVGKYESSILSK